MPHFTGTCDYYLVESDYPMKRRKGQSRHGVAPDSMLRKARRIPACLVSRHSIFQSSARKNNSRQKTACAPADITASRAAAASPIPLCKPFNRSLPPSSALPEGRGAERFTGRQSGGEPCSARLRRHFQREHALQSIPSELHRDYSFPHMPVSCACHCLLRRRGV